MSQRSNSFDYIKNKETVNSFDSSEEDEVNKLSTTPIRNKNQINMLSSKPTQIMYSSKMK